MNRTNAAALIGLVCLFLMAGPLWALDGSDIARLRKAGLSGETIQTIIDQKVIETCAFTVKEIVDLKESGLSDEEVRKIIKKGSFTRDSGPVIYGKSTQSINSLSPQEIVELKDAGISDEVIKSIVEGSFDTDDEEHRRAWRMLENMGWIIDGTEIRPR